MIPDACNFLCSLILVQICLELRTCTICTSPARPPQKQVCFHAKQNLISPALKLVLATEHTLTKAPAHPPLTKHACLYESPICVQLANTYSQTGEAP